METCQYCGRENELGAAHCPECGAAIPAAMPAAGSGNSAATPGARPSAWTLFGLAAAVVEGPFLAAMLIVQLFVECPHCHGVWLKCWPIAAGLVPIFSFRIARLRLPEWGFWTISGLITLAFIVVIFGLSTRTRWWRVVLGIGLAISMALALLTHALIAA